MSDKTCELLAALSSKALRIAKRLQGSVDQTWIESRVGVDTPITQERPVGSRFVDSSPFDFRQNNFFTINAASRDDLAAGRDDKTLPPKFDPRSPSRRFVADSIHHRDIAAIRNRVTALHRFPSGILGGAEFFLLGRMPSDRRRIKQDLRSAQSGQSRGFRIPLVPANADANFPMRGWPRLETKIAGSEIKLFVIKRVIRDMHLAVLTQVLPVSIDDDRGVMINASGPFFEKGGDNHHAGLPRHFL